jgi:hypothetical protein
MKNNTFIILTFLVALGTASNVFAGDIWKNMPHYPYSGAGRAHTNEVPVGSTSYSKEGGVRVQTITGEVKSINTEKKLFVVENRHDGITAIVLTDSQTIASLRPGQMVTVKLRSGSPIAQSVVIAGSEKRRSNNVMPSGRTYYSKEGGIQTKTIVGMVESVNTTKNTFVIKGEGAPTTVLTDSQAIASLHEGQTASVKLQSGSPFAISIAAGM